MLTWIFAGLLGVNAVLFGLGQGYLGQGAGNGREPGRMLLQFKAERLKLIAPAVAVPAAERPAPAADKAAGPDNGSDAQPQDLIACIEIGNFTAADARRFGARLKPLALDRQLSRHNVAGQEISGFIVFLPPQASKEAVDKNANELKQLGIENYFVISDNSPLHWAISLGVFKSESGAQKLLASLTEQGVRNVRIAPRMAASKQVAFQLRDLDIATKARLDRIKADFPAQNMRKCA